MVQPLIDLSVGYIKKDLELKSLDIPYDICKICASYINIDVIEITKDYPLCDYEIPIVFKARQTNETTLYFGCESYKITAYNRITFNLPYCFINETEEWYRVHGGGGNINGVLAAKHLSFIMKLKYISVDTKWGKFFNQKATDNLKQMYYSAYPAESVVEDPKLELNYMAKGQSSNDMAFFTSQSLSDMIIVYKS